MSQQIPPIGHLAAPFSFNCTGTPMSLWRIARTRPWPEWFRGGFFVLGMILDDLDMEGLAAQYLEVTINPLRMHNGIAKEYTVTIKTHPVTEA